MATKYPPCPEPTIEDPGFEKRMYPGLTDEIRAVLQANRGGLRVFLDSDEGRMEPRANAKKRRAEAAGNTSQTPR